MENYWPLVENQAKERNMLQYTDAVHKYDPATNAWSIVIDSMPTARSVCSVIVTPNKELMVVGGETTSGTNNYTRSKAVEIGEL